MLVRHVHRTRFKCSYLVVFEHFDDLRRIRCAQGYRASLTLIGCRNWCSRMQERHQPSDFNLQDAAMSINLNTNDIVDVSSTRHSRTKAGTR